MKKPVIITADSTIDLSHELIERFHIKTVPLTIVMGDETFLDSESFNPAEIYARYHKDGILPKTSAPSIQDFMDFFSSLTEQGYEVVHLDISSELSSTYGAAQVAANETGGVYVIDSRMLSTGIGLLVIEAAECRDRGMGAEEIAAHIEEIKDRVSTSFSRWFSLQLMLWSSRPIPRSRQRVPLSRHSSTRTGVLLLPFSYREVH